MTFQLNLAGPNQPAVCLSRKITKELQTYKKNAVRFIYNCYVTHQCGAILNIDLGMNHEHACAVGINALYMKALKNVPSILLCDESQFRAWFYFMKKYSGLEVFKLNENNVERLLKRKEAIILIVTEKEHAVLRKYVSDYHFFCLLVDQIDVMCEKMITKQLQADFHLGITHRNFITEPNQQILWKVINWTLQKSNPNFVKLNNFIEYDNAYLKAYVDPYSSFWHKITLNLCSESEIRQIEDNKQKTFDSIQQCAESHGFQQNETKTKRRMRSETPTKKQSPRKRSRNNEEILNKTKLHEETFEHWTSDEDNTLDLSVFQVNETPSTPTSSTSPRKLRLKSPVKQKLHLDDFNTSFVEFDPSIIKKGRRLSFSQSFVRDAVSDEFFQPFDDPQTATSPNNQENVKIVTNSDSDLVPNIKNVRQEVIEELNQEEIIREFSKDFEPHCSNTCISNEGLETLMTGNIITNNNPIDSCASFSSQSEELHLHLSEEICENDAGKCNKSENYNKQENGSNSHNLSSDDEIDNYMIQFLENMKEINKINPKSAEAFKFSTINSENSLARKNIDTNQRFLDDSDTDSENYLKELFTQKINISSHTKNVDIELDLECSSQEDNYLVSFL